jgi:hypothetical protein
LFQLIESDARRVRDEAGVREFILKQAENPASAGRVADCANFSAISVVAQVVDSLLDYMVLFVVIGGSFLDVWISGFSLFSVAMMGWNVLAGERAFCWSEFSLEVAHYG